MLIVFQSKAAADVLMFSSHALNFMQVAGRDYTDSFPERGVITLEQLPKVIKSIERAIETDKENDKDNPDTEDEDVKVHPISEPVSFRQRAWPLLEMLRASLAQNTNVTWEPAPKW